MTSVRSRSGKPLVAGAAVALALTLAPSVAGADPSERELRGTADRLLKDWTKGRLADSYARLSPALRAVVTLTQLQASLDGIRGVMGDYVSMREGRVTDQRNDGEHGHVLETSLRFARGEAAGRFIFVEDGTVWRLRFLKIDLPGQKLPQAAASAVAAIADEILGQLGRDGLASLVRLLPPQVREQYGDETLRRLFARTQSALGALRSHALDAPVLLGEECRQVGGRARFEHGEALLRIALCPDPSVWRLVAMDVQPRMTPPLFERLARVDVAEALGTTDFQLSCPARLVPVGAEASCRVESGGRTRVARVRRIEEGDLQVELAP